MIYTVTLNPSIDYIVHLDAIKTGHLNRSTCDFKLPGGKGINVSRILNRLGHKTTALGFIGGFTGKFIGDWIEKEGICNRFTRVIEDSRINVKLKASSETEINGMGPSISLDEFNSLKDELKKVQSKDTVIFAGSSARDLPENYYDELIGIIKNNKANFVIDTTGEDLIKALKYEPLLVKPNIVELEELFNVSMQSEADIILYGKKLLNMGAQYVVVSMGGDGAYLLDSKDVYKSEPLKGDLRNSVGSGDSMIAGFIGSYEKNPDPIQAFRYGLACGSATAFSDDLATYDKIMSLLNKVSIKKQQ